MPELPEVETIVRDLKPKLKGKKIKDFWADRPKQLNFPINKFKKKIVGLTICDVRRRAKMIIIDLSEGLSLLFHLKITGQLIMRDKDGKIFGGGHFIAEYLRSLPNRFTHAIFTFTDGRKLYFNNMRLFGYIKILQTKEVKKLFEKMKIGPEPLEKSFTFAKFKEIIEKRKIAKIKPLLMDQTFIAGIGNIYADETLFCAKIQPTRIAGLIKEGELRKLFQAIKKILSLAVKYRGSSIDTYVDSQGAKGKYAEKLKVYGRKKEKCLDCQTPLKSMKLGGRTTVYCPKCQK